MTTSVETFAVHYRVRSTAAEIEKRVESLLLEQTVEMPRAAVTDEFVKANIIGTVGNIQETAPGDFAITLLQPTRTT
ncbi:MAG: ribulose 1,5-bisphosphate carboxylase, partial [Candidatus Methylacidiphilales bacterium]